MWRTRSWLSTAFGCVPTSLPRGSIGTGLAKRRRSSWRAETGWPDARRAVRDRAAPAVAARGGIQQPTRQSRDGTVGSHRGHDVRFTSDSAPPGPRSVGATCVSSSSGSSCWSRSMLSKSPLMRDVVTLLSSRCSVRVQVRFEVRGSKFRFKCHERSNRPQSRRDTEYLGSLCDSVPLWPCLEA